MTSVAPKKPLGGGGGGGGGGGAGGQILHEGSVSSGPLARRHSEAAAQRLRDRERLSSLRLQKQVRVSDTQEPRAGPRLAVYGGQSS